MEAERETDRKTERERLCDLERERERVEVRESQKENEFNLKSLNDIIREQLY